ncbi:glycoside hydrolase family 32 protein [Brachybacterium subflavum]|uniref:glycoside hydrolase family 32 protein n=1 Tax=Brachybacterium subflavum TaxID=2585206 RepID=UPI0012662B54|nr:glycoside hydrolase family 32 protein [Brachybacterium subflavum]
MTHAPDPSFPALHRVHPTGWINDPNGIVRTDDRWHVHFQHNPAAPRHEDICWGHMSSSDLVSWRAEPDSIVPRPGEADAGGCWSGVALLDPAREGAATLVYSGVDGVDDERARVMLARTSADMTEILEQGHVVADVPGDLRLLGVRDPFVFEAVGHRYAIQGAGILDAADAVGDDDAASATPALLLYGCDDLESWELLGTLLTGEDPVADEIAPAEIWECPQLVQVDGDWVLLLSLWDRRGHAEGRSPRTVHLVGALEQDERGHPRFTARAGGPIDSGPDLYAPQAVQDRENDRVLMWGWSWEGEGRTQEQVDAQGWAGCLTFPRELVLENDRLLARVPGEIDALRDREELVIGNAVQVGAPPRLEVRAPHGARVEVLEADGAVRGIAALDGALRIFVDGSLLEAIGERTLPHTRRVHLADGEQLRISGQELQAWSLRIPDSEPAA